MLNWQHYVYDNLASVGSHLLILQQYADYYRNVIRGAHFNPNNFFDTKFMFVIKTYVFVSSPQRSHWQCYQSKCPTERGSSFLWGWSTEWATKSRFRSSASRCRHKVALLNG